MIRSLPPSLSLCFSSPPASLPRSLFLPLLLYTSHPPSLSLPLSPSLSLSLHPSPLSPSIPPSLSQQSLAQPSLSILLSLMPSVRPAIVCYRYTSQSSWLLPLQFPLSIYKLLHSLSSSAYINILCICFPPLEPRYPTQPGRAPMPGVGGPRYPAHSGPTSGLCLCSCSTPFTASKLLNRKVS